MHAFDVLGDPVRRRIIEVLSSGEQSAGGIVEVVADEFGISQPAVSRHLRVLRESGFVTAKPQGARRLYALGGDGFAEVEAWVERYRMFWSQRLGALDTELRRGQGKRDQRRMS